MFQEFGRRAIGHEGQSVRGAGKQPREHSKVCEQDVQEGSGGHIQGDNAGDAGVNDDQEGSGEGERPGTAGKGAK